MVLASAVVVAFLVWVVFMLTGWFGLPLQTSILVVQGLVTVSAIGVGGVYAWFKLQIFGDFSPHLTIDQSVSHRRISNGHIHLAVTAKLKNTSKIPIELRQGMYRLQQIAPLRDEDVEALFDQYLSGKEDEKYIQWPTHSEINNTWSPGSFMVEPGEVKTKVYEFIVPLDMKRVLVYAYFTGEGPWSHETFDDRETREVEFEEGWDTTTVYDLDDLGTERENV